MNQKAKAAKKKPGPPRVEFDQAIADRICEQIVDGKSLRRICGFKWCPSKKIVLRWLEENEGFRAQYARAKEEQAEGYADELIELGRQATSENANAIRVRADIIKWVCSKLKPKRYGDRLDLNAKVDATVEHSELSSEDLARCLWFADHDHLRRLTIEDFAAEQVSRLRHVAASIRSRNAPNGMAGTVEHVNPPHKGLYEDVALGLEEVAEVIRTKILALATAASGPLALPAPAPEPEPTTRAREDDVEVIE
jgi:hypothetical protein